MYVKWVEMILSQNPQTLSPTGIKKFEEKLSWVDDYKTDIKEWRAMLDILKITKHEIKFNGLSNKTLDATKDAINKLKITGSRLKTMETQIIEYIEYECRAIDGVYLGCSDIIESIFGKYKNFSGKSPMKEIGRAILIIPAFTSSINYREVKIAMETISAKEVLEWQKDNIGQSLFSKRKAAFKLKKGKPV